MRNFDKRKMVLAANSVTGYADWPRTTCETTNLLRATQGRSSSPVSKCLKLQIQLHYWRQLAYFLELIFGSQLTILLDASQDLFNFWSVQGQFSCFYIKTVILIGLRPSFKGSLCESQHLYIFMFDFLYPFFVSKCKKERVEFIYLFFLDYVVRETQKMFYLQTRI